MALWGVSDADESKPKYLSDADKKNCIAKPEGWVLKKTVGSRNLEEILVATGADLAVGIGQADITNIEFVSTAFDKSEGGTLSVKVIFNENVTVSGTPQLTVVNDQRANHTLSYAIGANNAATNAGDELSIGANAVSLNGGTIVDTAGGGNSTITNSAAIGTAAGTITVAA
jgi:hypothetical protein